MLDLTIHGDLHAVRRSLDRISTTLANKGIDPDMQGTVEIILAEIMNNIVKHAYDSVPNGHITVKLREDGGDLTFEIMDEGTALPASAVRGSDPDFINTPVEDLPEGGFGWQLIRSIAHNLDYQRADGKNLLSFRLPLDPTTGGECFEEKVRAQSVNPQLNS